MSRSALARPSRRARSSGKVVGAQFRRRSPLAIAAGSRASLSTLAMAGLALALVRPRRKLDKAQLLVPRKAEPCSWMPALPEPRPERTCSSSVLPASRGREHPPEPVLERHVAGGLLECCELGPRSVRPGSFSAPRSISCRSSSTSFGGSSPSTGRGPGSQRWPGGSGGSNMRLNSLVAGSASFGARSDRSRQ